LSNVPSGFTESGACDACGEQRKLRRIQSGQRLCRGCFRELKPPRPKHLVSYQTLAAFARLGITLPEETTKGQVDQLHAQMGVLCELVADVWYTLRKTSPFRDGMSEERLSCFTWGLVQAGDFGRALADTERERIREGHRLFEEAWRTAKAKRHPTLQVLDGRLLDEEGRDLAYFNFKPPLTADANYWRLVGCCRRPSRTAWAGRVPRKRRRPAGGTAGRCSGLVSRYAALLPSSRRTTSAGNASMNASRCCTFCRRNCAGSESAMPIASHNWSSSSRAVSAAKCG
jgi:ribosomal protein L37AE/L43A